MKILAFDQATAKTGYAVFQEDGTLEYGLINLSTKAFRDLGVDERCRLMVLKVGELIEAQAPDYVVIEDVALQRNARVLIELARIQGGIMGACDKVNIPVMIMKPSQWRKICALTQGAGVKRTELKLAAKLFALNTFGIKANSDEADAICIGWAAYVQIHNELKRGKKNGTV